MCSTEWATHDDFLGDKSIEINGYGADFEKLEWSLFYSHILKKAVFQLSPLQQKNLLICIQAKNILNEEPEKKSALDIVLDKISLIAVMLSVNALSIGKSSRLLKIGIAISPWVNFCYN